MKGVFELNLFVVCILEMKVEKLLLYSLRRKVIIVRLIVFAAFALTLLFTDIAFFVNANCAFSATALRCNALCALFACRKTTEWQKSLVHTFIRTTEQ